MNIRVLGGIAAVALLAGLPAGAATLKATAANYKQVFSVAKGGDTVVLSGSFGAISLRDRNYATTLTIDARGATFTDTFSMKYVSGVTLLGGNYGHYTSSLVAIRVTGGDRITISKATIIGNGTSRHGIDVNATTNVTIDSSTFSGLGLGAGFIGVTGGKMTNNKSIGSSSDGFNVADSHKVLVSRNSCTGGSPKAGAHPDCVQMWSTKGNAPLSDIEVSDNIATGATQGFTLFDHGTGGGDRIKLLRNRVNTSYPQGIACYDCRNSFISGNILTTLPGSKWRTVINVVGGRNNTITGNSIGIRPLTAVAGAIVPVLNTSGAGFTTPPDVLLNPSTTLPTLAAGAIPEPGTWAMMLGGFGVVGLAARRRQRLSRRLIA